MRARPKQRISNAGSESQAGKPNMMLALRDMSLCEDGGFQRKPAEISARERKMMENSRGTI